MSILVGSTVAGFSWMRQTKQAGAVAEEIKNELILARSTALATGRSVDITITSQNKMTINALNFKKTYSGFILATTNFSGNKITFIGNDAIRMGQINQNDNPKIDIKRDGKTEASLEVNRITGNVEIQ